MFTLVIKLPAALLAVVHPNLPGTNIPQVLQLSARMIDVTPAIIWTTGFYWVRSASPTGYHLHQHRRPRRTCSYCCHIIHSSRDAFLGTSHNALWVLSEQCRCFNSRTGRHTTVQCIDFWRPVSRPDSTAPAAPAHRFIATTASRHTTQTGAPR